MFIMLVRFCALFQLGQFIVSVTSYRTSSQLVTAETGPSVILPPGYVYHPSINAAFKVHRERSNWLDAKQACISEGGRLAVVDTLEKVGYVKANKPRFSDVWVGVTKEGQHWLTAENRNCKLPCMIAEGRPVRICRRNLLRLDLPWIANRPDSIGYCGIVSVAGDGLDNKLCIWRRAFVCEMLVPTYQTRQIRSPWFTVKQKLGEKIANYFELSGLT